MNLEVDLLAPYMLIVPKTVTLYTCYQLVDLPTSSFSKIAGIFLFLLIWKIWPMALRKLTLGNFKDRVSKDQTTIFTKNSDLFYS
jgi:hypothetical protein